MYASEVIDEVVSRSDIVDIISGYIKLKKNGSSYVGLCPFHNEKSPSFSVSPGKQLYHCFGCGVGGNVITFVMEYENYTFLEAVKYLADKAGMQLPETSYSEEEKKNRDLKAKLLEINKIAATYYYHQLKAENGKIGLSYLQKRGLSDTTINLFGLGYAGQTGNALYQYLKSKGYDDALLKETGLFTYERGIHDKFWNRVMFPIMDVHNRVIGFGGRVMGDGEPKYLNSPETKIFDKSRNLYGLNIARSTRKNQLLLCEGYMDVIALHQAGFDNAVASLGTALTSGHASLLKRYTNEVYLTYDSDGAGVKAALRAIPILKEVGITTKVINMRPYKDPDEFIKALGAQEYEERIKKAENSFMFQIRIMQAGYDMDDPESKTAFYNEIAKKLLGFTEELERTNYTQAVSREYSIPYDDLRKLVNSMAMKGGIVKPQTKLKSGINEKNKKEDGMKQSQKLLLTWLIEDNSLFDRIKGRISADDFTEELYHKVAKEVFSQYETTHTVNPARIVSMFTDEDEQREVAGLFNATIHQVEGKNDKATALRETVVRIKQNSIDYRSKHLAPTDMEGMMRIIEDKRALEELQKIPE